MGSFEEATEGEVPFLGIEWDLSNPISLVVVMVVGTIAFTFYHATSDIGANIAQKLNQILANLTGENVGSNSPENTGPAFGGE